MTIHWWEITFILFWFPLFYAALREPLGGWDIYFDTAMIFILCWIALIVLVYMKLLG